MAPPSVKLSSRMSGIGVASSRKSDKTEKKSWRTDARSSALSSSSRSLGSTIAEGGITEEMMEDAYTRYIQVYVFEILSLVHIFVFNLLKIQSKRLLFEDLHLL